MASSKLENSYLVFKTGFPIHFTQCTVLNYFTACSKRGKKVNKEKFPFGVNFETGIEDPNTRKRIIISVCWDEVPSDDFFREVCNLFQGGVFCRCENVALENGKWKMGGLKPFEGFAYKFPSLSQDGCYIILKEPVDEEENAELQMENAELQKENAKLQAQLLIKDDNLRKVNDYLDKLHANKLVQVAIQAMKVDLD